MPFGGKSGWAGTAEYIGIGWEKEKGFFAGGYCLCSGLRTVLVPYFSGEYGF